MWSIALCNFLRLLIIFSLCYASSQHSYASNIRRLSTFGSSRHFVLYWLRTVPFAMDCWIVRQPWIQSHKTIIKWSLHCLFQQTFKLQDHSTIKINIRTHFPIIFLPEIWIHSLISYPFFSTFFFTPTTTHNKQLLI